VSIFNLFKRTKNLALTESSTHSSKEIAIAVRHNKVTIARDEEVALAGNLSCQSFFAEMAMASLLRVEDGRMEMSEANVNRVRHRFIRFATLAAEQGHGNLQYNLGLALVNRVDIQSGYIDESGMEDLKLGVFWYSQAADNPNCTLRQLAATSAAEIDEVIASFS
jgi:TPR repeat protein